MPAAMRPRGTFEPEPGDGVLPIGRGWLDASRTLCTVIALSGGLVEGVHGATQPRAVACVLVAWPHPGQRSRRSSRSCCSVPAPRTRRRRGPAPLTIGPPGNGSEAVGLVFGPAGVGPRELAAGRRELRRADHRRRSGRYAAQAARGPRRRPRAGVERFGVVRRPQRDRVPAPHRVARPAAARQHVSDGSLADQLGARRAERHARPGPRAADRELPDVRREARGQQRRARRSRRGPSPIASSRRGAPRAGRSSAR